ncbi:hypothetical protein SAMN05421693_10162 [Ectothiorhodospira magna]|uniref:Uncharacterized protein n=1 Tax=Ectothiorhodospira magna TaxID=867345 RepID=A0A1H8YY40_9GAMM|nr:hypothetical protein SAMN05421693_10162 [Ectothiorhodospira magna]
MWSVHPRTCGERCHTFLMSHTRPGSSPHLRGTLACSKDDSRHYRFIPAPAGNASFRRLASLSIAVHPRTCGERSIVIYDEAQKFGSSPHLRGTLLRLNQLHFISRFIPAPAGNAINSTSANRRATVHPRTCGERPYYSFHAAQGHGSSPHLRGTRAAQQAMMQMERFIPAPAGNAARSSSRMNASAVHPRTCGERSGEVITIRVGVRFIPAPAGNAFHWHSDGEGDAVHPRTCGERDSSH